MKFQHKRVPLITLAYNALYQTDITFLNLINLPKQNSNFEYTIQGDVQTNTSKQKTPKMIEQHADKEVCIQFIKNTYAPGK